jgi:hypothetical protein
MMIGAARRESSQVLWMANVCEPPMKIEQVYSSMARLLSLYNTMQEFEWLRTVPDEGNVFDDDHVVGLFRAVRIQQVICFDHVLNDRCLGYLL